MSDVAITTAAEPDGAPRIAVLDIMRGIAILGILFMNINDMGQSLYASFDDIRHLGWSATDQIAWWLREVLANGTARCMLEMLFGAGMVILTDRVAERAGKWTVMRRYYLRNLVLFAFGLAHIFILLWPGDILHTYAISSLIVFLFRRLRPRFLIPLGLSMALFELFAGGYFGYYQTLQNRAQVATIQARVAAHTPISTADRKLLQKDAESAAKRAKNKAEIAQDIASEDTARTGNFVTWVKQQWWSIIDLESKGFELFAVWESASVMLIGAALYKLGVLQGRRSRRFYLVMTLVAYAIGVTLRVIDASEQMSFGDGPYLGWFTNEVARQAMTLGHIGLINLLAMSMVGAGLLRPFVAAGRTALSIYIAQTLICLWVLYPPFMLGLYGKMTWGPLMLTALAVNAVLLVLANIWVRYFDIAPVEWAWRSLIERRALPWRREKHGTVPIGHGEPAPAR